jgi:long-chain acyl-CoA synthetase
VIAPRFDPETFWDLVERVRPTYFSAVPTIYAMLMGLPAEVRPDTASLRCAVCGAAPMPAAAIHAFEDRYGVAILEGYGQSEGTVVTTANPLTGCASLGRWVCRCQGRRFGSSAGTTSRCRPAR